MNLTTSTGLTQAQINTGLKQVIRDGLATEAMSCLTEGTFLVALALHLGASNFQIGLLAALPTFTNIFQLAAIWLVRRIGNRRIITVASLALARLPLFLVGILPFWLSNETALIALTVLMFVHYLFGSVAGASWNSWVKDLVPGNQLGSYFSRRTRLTQTLNVALGLLLAFATNYVSHYHPEYVPQTFPFLFICGGLAGMISVFALYRAPEPVAAPVKESLREQFKEVFKDGNFKKMLTFNSFWVFGFNLAAPFFSVYMMKTMGMSLSSILCLNIIGQLSGILFISLWGKYADKYSNKSIIAICIPLYIIYVTAWIYVGSVPGHLVTLLLLGAMHIASGIATSGINLSLSNIGLKLSPANHAITFLAAKNMVTAIFSAAAPLLTGLLADRLSNSQLSWQISWNGTGVFNLLHLEGLNFFFLASLIFSVIALRLLRRVSESGEVKRRVIMSGISKDLAGKSRNLYSSASQMRVVFRARRLRHINRKQDVSIPMRKSA
jgi:MFS family permease